MVLTLELELVAVSCLASDVPPKFGVPELFSVVLRLPFGVVCCAENRISKCSWTFRISSWCVSGTTNFTQLQHLCWTKTSNLFLIWCYNEVEHKGDKLEVKENAVAGQKLKVRPRREASAMKFNLHFWIKAASDAIFSSSFLHHTYHFITFRYWKRRKPRGHQCNCPNWLSK